MNLDIDDRFVAQCSPVIDSNFDTCGTVTRSTIAHLTKTQLNAIFTPGGLFADLDAWFVHSIEMKACGVQRYALYDWIFANADRTEFKAALNTVKGVKTKSLLQPFVFGAQETVINKDHWKITAGWSNTAYDALNGTDGDNTYPLSDAQLALGAGSDRVVQVTSRYGVPTDPNWFREKDTIHIFGRAGGGDSEHGQWRVLAAAANSDLTAVHVLITSLNAGSSETFAAAPTTGVIISGVNNINDYEKWCQNLPRIDPRKRVPFWFQTMRNARCVDSEYREVYKRLMQTNPAFRAFGDIDLAKTNAQDEREHQKRFVNAFFYNKPISTNQTLDLWESLEAINTATGSVVDPGTGGKIIGRRANFVGAREQLRLCDRVWDLQNVKVNFYDWLDLNYNLVRARKTNKQVVKEIDWFTNSVFAANFQTAAMAYYKAEHGDQARWTINLAQLSTMDQSFDQYTFKRPAGIKFNIIVDEYFDDFRDQFDDQSIVSRGNLFLALDIGKPGPNGGTIYWSMLGSSRKVYTSAKIEELARLDATYRCVMETVSQEQTLTSETGTVIVECPLNSVWIENFDSDAPLTTGAAGQFDIV